MGDTTCLDCDIHLSASVEVAGIHASWNDFLNEVLLGYTKYEMIAGLDEVKSWNPNFGANVGMLWEPFLVSRQGGNRWKYMTCPN